MNEYLLKLEIRKFSSLCDGRTGQGNEMNPFLDREVFLFKYLREKEINVRNTIS